MCVIFYKLIYGIYVFIYIYTVYACICAVCVCDSISERELVVAVQRVRKEGSSSTERCLEAQSVPH